MLETLIAIILVPIALMSIIFALGIIVGVFRYIFDGGGKRGRKKEKNTHKETETSP